MANYNSYHEPAQVNEKEMKPKRVDFSSIDHHEKLKTHFLIRFNVINEKLNTIKKLINKVTEQFSL